MSRPDLVPVIAFDLDLTLLDTHPAVRHVLQSVAVDLGITLDVKVALDGLGPPLTALLEQQLDAESAARVAAQYRRRYVTEGPPHARLLDGAADALAAVRRHRGRIVVVTGQSQPSAEAHLHYAGFEVDAVVGGAWGTRKASHLIRHRAWVYVGDHPDDLLAARTARLTGVIVTTGQHDAEHFPDADAVLPTLVSFDPWLTKALAEGAIVAPA